jgi:exonuclease III
MASFELSAWNIQGGFDTKLSDDDFTSHLTSDILCLTETWCLNESVNNLIIPNDYVHMYSCRSNTGSYKSGSHCGGGVSVLIRKKLSHFISQQDSPNDDFRVQ